MKDYLEKNDFQYNVDGNFCNFSGKATEEDVNKLISYLHDNVWVKENITDFKVVITGPHYHMVMDEKENLVRKMDEKHTV